MELFQIILLGIAINFMIMIVMLGLMFVVMMSKLNDVDAAKKFLLLEDIKQELDRVKLKLIEKNMSIKIQKDFIIFVPYAMLLEFFVLLYYMVFGSTLDFIGIKLIKKLDILERRLNNNI